MVIGARQAGLSTSQTADLLGISRTTTSGRKYPAAVIWVKMPF